MPHFLLGLRIAANDRGAHCRRLHAEGRWKIVALIQFSSRASLADVEHIVDDPLPQLLQNLVMLLPQRRVFVPDPSVPQQVVKVVLDIPQERVQQRTRKRPCRRTSKQSSTEPKSRLSTCPGRRSLLMWSSLVRPPPRLVSSRVWRRFRVRWTCVKEAGCD